MLVQSVLRLPVRGIREILDFYRPIVDFKPLSLLDSRLESMDHAVSKSALKSLTSTFFAKYDFRITRRAAIRSAVFSTGQADGFRRVSFTMDRHRAVLPLLTNPLMTPSERTLFYQVLIGCDFLTPFSHAKKPKCRFCKARNTTPRHLLLECPKVAITVPGQDAAVVGEAKSQLGEAFEWLVSPTDRANNRSFFWALMGISDIFIPKSKKYLTYLRNLLTKITANKLLSLKFKWVQALS